MPWIVDFGRPANRGRNAAIHAVTFTAPENKQAMQLSMGVRQAESLALICAPSPSRIKASMKLPT